MPSASVRRMTLAQRYEYLRKLIKKHNGIDGRRRKRKVIDTTKVHDDHGLDGSYYLKH